MQPPIELFVAAVSRSRLVVETDWTENCSYTLFVAYNAVVFEKPWTERVSSQLNSPDIRIESNWVEYSCIELDRELWVSQPGQLSLPSFQGR